MAVTYTTAVLVKKRVKDISADLLDADIEENIYQSESICDALMKCSARGTAPDFTFDSMKHGILRDACTNLAAFLSIVYDPGGSFPALANAEIGINTLWNLKERGISLLSDPRIVDYIKAL